MTIDYPIRLFNTRPGRDTLKNRGYPGDEPPSYLLRGKALKEHRKSLDHGFAAICDMATARFKDYPNLPIVFTAKIGKDKKGNLHSSRTKRTNIAELFDYKGMPALIGMDGSDALRVRAVSSEHVNEIRRRLRSGSGYDLGVSLVESIAPYRPIIAEAFESQSRYKLKLLDFQDKTVNEATQRMVVDLLGEEGAYCCDYGTGNAIYALDGEQAKAVCDQLVAVGIVQSLTEMPSYFTGFDEMGESEPIVPLPHLSDRTYPRLGILDSGIAGCDALAPWVLGRSNPNYGEELLDRTHGTCVAGTAVYGDRLAGTEWTGVEDGVELFDATIVPGPGEPIYEDELIHNIQEALDAHHNAAKVWNLSVSIKREIDRDGFSDFAVFLDKIQAEYDILICKSAGNNDRFIRREPSSRLSVGADSLRSLVIGSIAHEQGAGDLVAKGRRSPFSCVGPGLEGNVKPDLVHFGGNARIDAEGRVAFNGVRTVSPKGSVVSVAGTSFSSPRVAALAAGLAHELGEKANPMLIKAMLVHFARYVEQDGDNESTNAFPPGEYGYGVPSALPALLAGNPNETTLILTETILPTHYLEINDFPMPAVLVRDGFYDLTGNLTLVTNPILDSSQGLEYCQSDVEVRFGTYGRKNEHDTTQRGHPNPVTIADTHNLCCYDLLSKRELGKHAEHRYERVLIEEDMKFCPVRRFYFNTALMTPRNRDNFSADGKWFLRLTAGYRNRTKRMVDAGVLNHGLDFCMILTLRDPHRQGRLYDEMVQRLDACNFVQTALHVRSENRVEVQG